MSALLLALAALGPALLALPGLVPAAVADANPRPYRRAVLAAALAALGLAAFVAAVLAWTGRAVPSALIQLDAVSATMFLLVSGVGAAVADFARRYLDGDAGQGRFMRWLSLALASTLALVLAGHVAVLAVAFILSGMFLGRLLLFYGDRPGAVLAARKNAWVSRAADACLVLGAALVWLSLGTGSVAGIKAALAALPEAPLAVCAAAVLLALAAILKSAQFPAHAWLTEVMETPTPVSALLHAGIINAGGFVLVRLADVMATSAAALDLLLLVGAFTAMFGAAVMLTQTSVKLNLAWSTIAQMGFMIMQVGLGAWAAALLHIVAHAIYKAHAFLSAGGVAQSRRPAKPDPLPLRVLLPAMAGAVLLTLTTGALLGMPATTDPGPAVLGAVLVMALVPTLASGAAQGGAYGVRAVAIAAGVAVAWFGLQAGAAALLAPALPAHAPDRSILAPLLSVLAVLSFAALLALNVARRAPVPARWVEALYVHLHHGFYVNALMTRLAARIRPASESR